MDRIGDIPRTGLWRAQPGDACLPAYDAAVDAAPDSPVEGEAVPAEAPSDAEAPPDFPDEPLLRKSVTYQPDPFSWKPAAVTCLT